MKKLLIIPFILLYISAFTQQIRDTSVWPLDQYLFTQAGEPYPYVNCAALASINTSGFTNVMNHGATGNGVTNDGNAIQAAINAATTGVIFPPGFIFLVGKPGSDYTITLPANKNLVFWAYGATIKMANMTRYSWLSLDYNVPLGSYGGRIIWLGGTLDGNQANQSYPHSPTGNDNWAEDHGRFIAVVRASFALFKDVTLINTVMDGLVVESTKLGVMANCKAIEGAPINWGRLLEEGFRPEQGTYFKATRVSMGAFYAMNLRGDRGSIGLHYSYPTAQQSGLTPESLAVVRDCHFTNAGSNSFHFEDAYKVFMLRCSGTYSVSPEDKPQVHLFISNLTRIATVISCNLTDGGLNTLQTSNMKLMIVDKCNFRSTLTNFLPGFLVGRPHVVTNCTFLGQCINYQAAARNLSNCSFTNFGQLGGNAINMTNRCSFTNGVRPVSTFQNGWVRNCTFTNVTNSGGYSPPPAGDNSWQAVFTSYVDIYSHTGAYLGRIQATPTL